MSDAEQRLRKKLVSRNRKAPDPEEVKAREVSKALAEVDALHDAGLIGFVDHSILRKVVERHSRATKGPWRWGDWHSPFGTPEVNRNTLEANRPFTQDDFPLRRRRDEQAEHILTREPGSSRQEDLDFLAWSWADVSFMILLVKKILRKG